MRRIGGRKKTVAVKEEKEETGEMPPLGHQSRLILQNVNDMLQDHHQDLHERIDKQDE